MLQKKGVYIKVTINDFVNVLDCVKYYLCITKERGSYKSKFHGTILESIFYRYINELFEIDRLFTYNHIVQERMVI